MVNIDESVRSAGFQYIYWWGATGRLPKSGWLRSLDSFKYDVGLSELQTQTVGTDADVVDIHRDLNPGRDNMDNMKCPICGQEMKFFPKSMPHPHYWCRYCRERVWVTSEEVRTCEKY